MSQLRRLEIEVCRGLARQPRLQLEVKRRIAESLLDMSIAESLLDMSISGRRRITTCRSKLRRLAKLGFTDIEQKAHYHFIYARFALEEGHPKIASKVARDMILELRIHLSRRRSLLGRSLLNSLEQLTERMGEQPSN